MLCIVSYIDFFYNRTAAFRKNKSLISLISKVISLLLDYIHTFCALVAGLGIGRSKGKPADEQSHFQGGSYEGNV